MTALQQELLEVIRYYIAGGFHNREEILDSIEDMFYEEDDLDENWIQQRIAQAYAERLQEQRGWPALTTFDRLSLAFDNLNAQGIIAMHNAGNTLQDGESDVWEMHHSLAADGVPTKGYCFYHAQDLERAIDQHQLYLAFGSFENSPAAGTATGQAVVQALQEQGFKVEWNGTTANRILVNDLLWQKCLPE